MAPRAQDADFVVLDFAVNDGHISPPGRDKYGYSFAGGPRRGFEQLVRRPAVLPPRGRGACSQGATEGEGRKMGVRGA
jgi:hypothetical protein